MVDEHWTAAVNLSGNKAKQKYLANSIVIRLTYLLLAHRSACHERRRFRAATAFQQMVYMFNTHDGTYKRQIAEPLTTYDRDRVK